MRKEAMFDYDTPVKSMCIPAANGTKAIIDENGKHVVGPPVVAFVIGIRQGRKGADIWPDATWVEPIMYNSHFNAVGIVHYDGSVEYGDGATFATVAAWEKYMQEKYPELHKT
jgi:hypothetical protein